MPSYTEPGLLTFAGKYESLFDGLPGDVAGLARVAQGLLIHEFLAHEYGVTLTDESRATVHLRPVEAILDAVVSVDDRPLDQARPPERRVASNCRGFTVLTVAMLRARGVPARARCGFGNYFGGDGFHEDHWVAEWYDAGQDRWRLADAQLDEKQRGLFSITFDVTDVPRDRFVVAGDAWTRYRSGAADPDRFGLSSINEAGAWWIAGNLARDAAALTGVEVLPWDCWGVMPEPTDPVDEALFDRLAELTREPSVDELSRFLRDDERVRVPDTVRNALRQRQEPLR
ncbi:transglutaminase domain-containing protein [Jidongwangia harbinensis]|uniref:transglutaminase domain-containing protein n=1 Tax=Jidongwangia harbinensis TaxID=2878561 RepID=UPI001CD94E71|nr:transglutaminase domain-containing protein [Jidongwangia harbinensis]MCA2213027.1 transglutaminase domain-containing protein [Jidongwangia harbinensis]